MNRKLGMYSSLSVIITVVLFAVSMITGSETVSYLICMILSWGYLLMVCCLTTEILPERKGLAYGATAFACIYGVFINLVYFTQLTAVAYETAPDDVLQVLSYQNVNSLMFNLDLLGYGMMSISTLLIGIAIKPANRVDQWLRALLMIHGVFAISCILLPMFNVFASGMGSGGEFIGTYVLLFWCSYFLPVGILSLIHFKNSVTLIR